jgi:hypothetical protein
MSRAPGGLPRVPRPARIARQPVNSGRFEQRRSGDCGLCAFPSAERKEEPTQGKGPAHGPSGSPSLKRRGLSAGKTPSPKLIMTNSAKNSWGRSGNPSAGCWIPVSSSTALILVALDTLLGSCTPTPSGPDIGCVLEGTEIYRD